MTLKTKTFLAIIFGALLSNLLMAKPAAAGTSATFLRTDTKTQGTWKGVYGGDGAVIPNVNPTTNKVPGYASFTPEGEGDWTWASSAADVRDLQVAGNVAATARQASCWYTFPGSGYSLNVNITDGNAHQIAIYALDWDNRGRSERIEVTDAASGALLDTENVSTFTNGIYLVWDITGNVKFTVTRTSGDNAVISGAFFDAATTTNSTSGIAHFVTSDTSKQGNWEGAYGADGYSVVGDKQAVPTYAVFSPQNQNSWTWAPSTSDTRALELSSGAGRIAATWFNSPSFTLDVNITDGATHQFALYALDWDSKGRAETVQVLDAATNALLDSRNLVGFTNGVYEVWTISGHVKFVVTATSGPNAVISGVFFGVGGTIPTPPVTIPTVPTPPTTPSTPSSGLGSTTSSSNPNCPPVTNAVSFNGIDTTTQGAWKGVGNFNAPPASSSLVYGKDGVILPDTEGCDQACNPFPKYVAFGPSCVSSSTPGNTGSKPNSTHAYVSMVQADPAVMGPEPANATNTKYFQCNFSESNPASPWALMVAWRPVVDTRELSEWYTCPNINSFYLELNFGNSTHNFEVYAVDDQHGGTKARSEEIQVLDGDTNAVLYDSGSFTNFAGGVYYKWSLTGHVKVKVINTSTNGSNAVINGAFFN